MKKTILSFLLILAAAMPLGALQKFQLSVTLHYFVGAPDITVLSAQPGGTTYTLRILAHDCYLEGPVTL